ncbi:t108 [Tupaiid betaherpesvirus 1]|uniref:T108 n=1 Tax=Tupaiid herpesvirus 1 (strain 1) TaxID=10397 RepID=Q91TJ5_TUHV1|nr:t108 [Tupaiid betaherpesvirus 1]AAK57152.1 t108 [Tupaiid betaherpesvirus 1]
MFAHEEAATYREPENTHGSTDRMTARPAARVRTHGRTNHSPHVPLGSTRLVAPRPRQSIIHPSVSPSPPPSRLSARVPSPIVRPSVHLSIRPSTRSDGRSVKRSVDRFRLVCVICFEVLEALNPGRKKRQN